MTAPTNAEIERCVGALMQMARDLVDGRITPADVEGPAVAQCEQLFGTVSAPGDPLWELQCRVARGVLAAGGIPANELAEWLAVTRLAEGEPEAGPSWIERALAEGIDDQDGDD